MLYNNDEAIAYSWFMIVVLLVIGALLWMCLSYGYNMVMDTINADIAAGTMSEQTRGPIAFGMAILGSVPIFLLVGALIWSVLAGVIDKNKGG